MRKYTVYYSNYSDLHKQDSVAASIVVDDQLDSVIHTLGHNYVGITINETCLRGLIEALRLCPDDGQVHIKGCNHYVNEVVTRIYGWVNQGIETLDIKAHSELLKELHPLMKSRNVTTASFSRSRRVDPMYWTAFCFATHHYRAYQLESIDKLNLLPPSKWSWSGIIKTSEFKELKFDSKVLTEAAYEKALEKRRKQIAKERSQFEGTNVIPLRAL